MPAELTPYVPLLATVLGKVGTAKRDFQDLSSEIDIHTGGIHCDVAAIADQLDPGVFHPEFVVNSKATLPKLGRLLDLTAEMLLSSRLDDKARLKEIIQETKIAVEMTIVERGHTAAAVRAAAFLSPAYAYRDATGGLAYYQFLDDLDRNFDQRADV